MERKRGAGLVLEPVAGVALANVAVEGHAPPGWCETDGAAVLRLEDSRASLLRRASVYGQGHGRHVGHTRESLMENLSVRPACHVDMITYLAVLDVILFQASLFSRNSRGRSDAQANPSLSSRDPSSLLNIVPYD